MVWGGRSASVPTVCGSAAGGVAFDKCTSARREEGGQWRKEEREQSLNHICSVSFEVTSSLVICSFF